MDRLLVDFDRIFYASPPSSAIIEERLWQHAVEQHQTDTSVALDRQVRLRGHGDVPGLLGTLRDAWALETLAPDSRRHMWTCNRAYLRLCETCCRRVPCPTLSSQHGTVEDTKRDVFW